MAEYTLSQLRTVLRGAGCKVTIRRYSEFCAATITAADGERLTGSHWFRSDEEAREWNAKYSLPLEIMEKYAGHTFYGQMRVVF